MTFTTAHTCAQLLTASFIFAASFTASAADLYAPEDIESIDISGIQLGDTAEDARLTIANYFSVKSDAIKVSSTYPLPELVDEHLSKLEYFAHKRGQLFTVRLTLDMDGEDVGYIVANRVSLVWKSQGRTEDPEKKMEDFNTQLAQQVEKTTAAIGPPTVERVRRGNKIFEWCTELISSKTECVRNSTRLIVMEREGMELISIEYADKLNAYLDERKKK